MNIPLMQSMATEQGLLSFQLLQYHILMPSLLISKRSSECQGCPSRLENMREAKLANHLAINQLSHIIIGHLATHSTRFPKPDGHDEFCSYNSCFPAVTPKKNSTTTAEPITPATPFTTGPVAPVTPFTTGPVAPGQFPFLVSIQVTNFHNTYLHLCGGTIISPTWILTAAHCLETERPSELVVVSGETDIGTPIDPEKMTLVTEFFKHPNYTYDVKPYVHDVALIHLAAPVIESEFVQIAPLPDTSFRDSGVECQEAGWGPTRDNEPGSNIMKVLTIPILPKDHCNAAYSTILGDTSICAGLDGIGSCVGDNGGPLVCNSKPVAIMSWRDGCARPGKPAVYMDIAKYLPWIGEITGLDL